MTKKFIHTDKTINPNAAKKEFLIPDIYDNTNSFVGLESLSKYRFGLIVYTGVEMNLAKVFERANKISPIGFFKRKKVKRVLGNYLIQIKSHKIGDTVQLTSSGGIEKINAAKRCFKRKCSEERTEAGNNWGESIWFLETDFEGYPTRQIEIYINGKRLKYSENRKEDEFGGLGDQRLDLIEFETFEITKTEFEKEWNK